MGGRGSGGVAGRLLLVGALILGLSSFATAPPASAAPGLPSDGVAAMSSLVADGNCRRLDAADGDTSNGVRLPYRFCDDGVPATDGGDKAIPVPAAYHSRASGGDWHGLPRPARGDEMARKAARDDLRPERGNRISLDVDVTLPVGRRPKNGRPVIVFMHGCCGGNKTGWESDRISTPGEKWHHSNAWFAARGYVVITYTARGFVNANDEGSTGTTQLDSRRYEINDYQYLVGLLADHDAMRRRSGRREVFDINPRRIGAVGGSYGGGFAWLALTDPTWRSPLHDVRMKLGAVVPKYGWTDLAEALVPGGHYRDRDPRTGRTVIAPSDPKRAVSRRPIGVKKESIVDGLYAAGNAPGTNHATFPIHLQEAAARLSAGEPYDGDPQLKRVVNDFLNNRSAYFQRSFWQRVRRGMRVPAFIAATWTDPLFPTMESVRFYNKLKRISPRYPMQMYLGDYQHFAANKNKEWSDMCGGDHHVCTLEDHTAGGRLHLERAPSRVRKGINSRIDDFLDHHLRNRGPAPPRDVSATTTICAANATAKYPVDEPGIEYRAPSWRALAPGEARFSFEGDGMTSTAAVDGHAPESDPVFRDRQANKCHTTAHTPPGPGVVQYTSEPTPRRMTLMGIPSMKLNFTTDATDYWIAVRFYDLAPDDRMTMVTRGVCRVNKVSHPKIGCHRFDLFGNGWRFGAGHRIVLELSQADSPFLRKDNVPSVLDFSGAAITLPLAPDHLEHDFRS